MKQTSTIIIGILAFVLSSCSNIKDYPKVDYKYSENNFNYGDCEKGLAGCVQIKLKSIKIINAPSPSKDSITNKLNDFILSPVVGEDSYKTVEEIRDSMIASYQEMKKEFPEMPLGYQLQRTVAVETDTLGVFSVRLDNYYFLGGAHPNYFTSFINTDLSNGSDIKLSGILNSGYENELNKIGEREFRTKRNLKPNEDLTEAGYWFDKGIFKLNDNFVITNKGLSFFFNSYEVGPYAFGTTEILIGYTEIKDLIRKDGILGRFID